MNVVTLGLFDKRIEGDDSLMELARRRFVEAGMGAEMPAGTPEQLEALMRFRPGKDAPVVVHLPRELNLEDPASQQRIINLARRFAGEVSGFVIHDHAALAVRRGASIDAAWRLDNQLDSIYRCPTVFVEYAAGLESADFVRFFQAIPDLDRISACIDIGHVAIRAARVVYAKNHGGEELCALRSQGPRLPRLMADIEAAVEGGVAAVFELLDAFSGFKKPLHFHLHDAHPLSMGSAFGVSDHLSFLSEIPLAFEHRGRRTVPPMFGPAGLSRLVARALERIGARRLSFTLEIHPTGERLPLGDAASLFAHWTDKTNAERMNAWLSVLTLNHRLLRQALQAAIQGR